MNPVLEKRAVEDDEIEDDYGGLIGAHITYTVSGGGRANGDAIHGYVSPRPVSLRSVLCHRPKTYSACHGLCHGVG